VSIHVDFAVIGDDQKTVIYQFRGEFPSLTALSRVLASVASSMDGKSDFDRTGAKKYKYEDSAQQTSINRTSGGSGL
jgi:hypothetical protein